MAIRSRAALSLLCAASSVLMVLVLASPAQAAVFTVNSTADAPDANPGNGVCATAGGVCTLRAGVMEANALVALGTQTRNRIYVPPRTYTLTLAGKGEDGAAIGDLDVNGGALAIIALVVRRVGDDVGTVSPILDANNLDRAFHVGPLSPTQFSLQGFTLRNGNAVSTPPNLSSTGPDVGGAIRVERNSGLLVRTATFSNNHAGSRGGGIGLPTTAGTPAGADPTIITDLNHVTFENNSAVVEAGGFFNNRVAKLKNVVVRTNRVTGTSGLERGAGIANSGDITLIDVLLSGNTMPVGSGGGIANRGDPIAGVFGTIRPTNVTVSNNEAPNGGGVANGNAAIAIIENSTISGNQAVNGGGIVNLGAATLTNVTLSQNSAPFGGGIFTVGPPLGDGNASTTLRNTILSHGPVGGNCLLPPVPIPFARPPTSAGDNISSDLSCGLAGAGDLNGVDPLLGPLANNGGFTPTHALLPGSPAIDRVLNNVCPPPATDQRGVTRPQGPRCDIGAYERV